MIGTLVSSLTCNQRPGAEPAADAAFAAFLEAAPDAMVIVDGRGRILLANAQAEALFGYARCELIGQPVEVLMPERFRHVHGGHRAGYFAEPRTRAMGSGLELFGLRKDGSEFSVEISLSPVATERGTVIASAIRDITERLRVQDALRRAKEEAELASRDLQSFSYSVAHDLRAPLRGIDGFSQILLEDHAAGLDAEGRRCLAKVRESAQQMARLIDSLLTLARVTQTDIGRSDVDLSALARASARRLQRSDPERPVQWVIAEGLTDVGDVQLLGIACDNLLSNAFKFTSRKPLARIEFGCTREGERSVYFVRDNGAGFDMAYAGKLFGVFQRLHTPTEFDGTGIGLATVERIVRRHGGRIWAEGKVAEGATFYFTLDSMEALR